MFRRRIPFWGSETLEAFEYANFFKLAITILAVLFVPAHYFKKFPNTVLGKSKLFMTPFKILTSFASAAAIFLGWIGFRFEHSAIIAFILIASLTAPIWIYLFVGVVWYVRKLLAFPKGIGSINDILDVFFEPFWFETDTNNLWSMETFRRLNYGAYFQALMIFVIYVFVTLPIALCPLFVSGTILLNVSESARELLKYFTGPTALYFTALLVSWMYVRPTVFLYRETLEVPTEAAFKADLHDLSVLVEKLWNGKTSVIDKEHAKHQMTSRFADVVHQWRRSEIRAKREHPTIYGGMLTDRASGALEPILAIAAFLSEDEVYLRACIEAIRNAQPLDALQRLQTSRSE